MPGELAAARRSRSIATQEAPAGPGARSLRAHPLLRRLPLLLFAALALVLYQAGFFPRERELAWRLGEDRASIRSVELQLWSAQGELLKREQLSFPEGPGPELSWSISLLKGEYQVQIFVRREGEAKPRLAGRQQLSIGHEERYDLSLLPPWS